MQTRRARRQADAHRIALCLLLFGAACRGDDHPSPVGDTVSVVVEQPAWKFGEESSRTDTLPPALDSLAEWGDYRAGARPVAYRIDLNGDGSDEWFVRADRTMCGNGGCPIALMTPGANGAFTDALGGLARDVYVTNRKVRGWPVLWVLGGGRDGGLFRMEYANSAYGPAGTLSRTKVTEAMTSADDSLSALLNRTPSR